MIQGAGSIGRRRKDDVRMGRSRVESNIDPGPPKRQKWPGAAGPNNVYKAEVRQHW